MNASSDKEEDETSTFARNSVRPISAESSVAERTAPASPGAFNTVPAAAAVVVAAEPTRPDVGAQQPAPERIGPYTLALQVASGGMATVYLAVQNMAGLRNTVAVKQIHPHLAKDRQFIDMFADEARITTRINHPYVCRVFDFGRTEGGGYYLAMEYLRGQPLSNVFKALDQQRVEEPSHPAIVARIIAKLAEGLHAAHTLRDVDGQPLEVIHRDVSPHNLFVLSDGTVRVTDFGIARARVRSHHSKQGQIKGKLSYMSPEQLGQRPMDARSDIWSLGVVAWELLTGQRLFRASSEGETVLGVLNRPVPLPSTLSRAVTAELDEIIARALSRDPGLRFASARDFSRALERFLSACRHSSTAQDVSEWVEALFPGAAARSQALVEQAHAAAITRIGPSPTAPLPSARERAAAWLWHAVYVGRPVRALVALALTAAGAAWLMHHVDHRDVRAELLHLHLPTPHEAPPASSAVLGSAPLVAALPPALVEAPPADAPKKSARSPVLGTIHLLTTNGKARVSYNGRAVGTTPLVLKVPEGIASFVLKPLAGGNALTVAARIEKNAVSVREVALPPLTP